MLPVWVDAQHSIAHNFRSPSRLPKEWFSWNGYPSVAIAGVITREITIRQDLRVRLFCLRQSGTFFLLVFGFSAHTAEKPNTQDATYPAAAGEKAFECRTPRKTCS